MKKTYLSSFACSGVLIATTMATGVIDQMNHGTRLHAMKFFCTGGDRDGDRDDFRGAR